MQETELASWDEFESAIRTLRNQYPGQGALLFRGLADADWGLTTTLERHDQVEMPFDAYYRLISSSEPLIRSFTEAIWDDIEDYSAIRELCADERNFQLVLFQGLKAFGYLAFLRHFGFPSPLLDWTRSPAIAAFHAYRNPSPPTSAKIAIFAYCDRPLGMKSLNPVGPIIWRLGSDVRTARRHHLQQGEYTLCLQTLEKTVCFAPHDRVFASGSNPRQDLLLKFTIPWSERVNVLERLDDYNVNAFSLFESNEALLETIAFRRLIIEPAKQQRLDPNWLTHFPELANDGDT